MEDYTQFYILQLSGGSGGGLHTVLYIIVEGGSGGGLHTVLYIIVERWKWWRTTHSSIYYS